jgi:hypothetical protein
MFYVDGSRFLPISTTIVLRSSRHGQISAHCSEAVDFDDIVRVSLCLLTCTLSSQLSTADTRVSIPNCIFPSCFRGLVGA